METRTTERGVVLVKICDPKKAGDYLWLAQTEFDPAVHQPFVTEPGAAQEAAPAPPESKGNSLEGYDSPITARPVSGRRALRKG